MLLRAGTPPSAGRALSLLTVTAIEPAVGAEAGGTEVVITGTRFQSGATVAIGGEACTAVVVVNDTTIQCTTPAGSGTDDVVVTTGHGLATLAGGFEYSASPPPAAIDFASDWGHDVGTTSTILRDNNKWSTVLGSSNSLEVVAATGLDFPTTNVLRIEQQGTAKGVIGQALWGVPDIGETIYKRIYWRNGVTTAIPGAGFNHLVQACRIAGGDCPSAWLVNNYPGGSAYSFGLSNEHSPLHRWLVTGGLAYNTTYRVEWAMTRISETGFNVQMRIYTSAGALLKSGADLSCTTHSGAHTMATTPAIEVTVDDPDTLADSLIGWQGGTEAGGDGKAGEYIYVGGFAVSLSDWCGAYSEGEGS